jgi:two-component system nitrate/nitrite response regulator NarL
MNSIVIADQHTLCREALCDFIRNSSHNLIIEGVGDFKSLCDLISRKSADLVLIESSLLDGKDQPLPEIFSSSKIGVLVSSLDASSSMNEDVHGIFPKSLSSKAFLGGVEDILSGKTFFPKAEYPHFSDQMSLRAKPFLEPREFGLTAREREVLSYLVKGASNKDIARSLDLQVVTVKLHVRGICRKLKAANRTQAALIAKENGWN